MIQRRIIYQNQYTNDLHDRSSSSKSDDERQRTIIVHRTIYKLRVATKLIKSMRLTEASSLLVLRIDLIGLLPLPSLPPPFLLSLLFHKYIYICTYLFHGRYTLSSNVETLEMRKPRSGTPATGELSFLRPPRTVCALFPPVHALERGLEASRLAGRAAWGCFVPATIDIARLLVSPVFQRRVSKPSGWHADTLSHKFAIKASPGLRTLVSLSKFLVLPRQIWSPRREC